MKTTPSQREISRVMSALGKRNRGKAKTMTAAARLQRSNAGKASAKMRSLRLASAPRTAALLSPDSRAGKPPPPRRTRPVRNNRKKELPTYPRKKTDPLLMGCGKGKPTRVIDGDRLMEYVGIGWIEERKATAEDRKLFPTLI